MKSPLPAVAAFLIDLECLKLVSENVRILKIIFFGCVL